MAEEKTQKDTDDLAACTDKDLEAFDLDFSSSPKNELAMNIVIQTALLKAALSRKARLTHPCLFRVHSKRSQTCLCTKLHRALLVIFSIKCKANHFQEGAQNGRIPLL
eukprot:984834_1